MEGGEKSYFFEINKIDNPLARLRKNKDDVIYTIRNETEDITTDPIE